MHCEHVASPQILECSSRSRQHTQLLRHVTKSNEFADAVSEGNMWAYPYSPCKSDDQYDFMNQQSVWEALHVDVDWMNSGGTAHLNRANDTGAWTQCAWIDANDQHYDINGTDKQIDQVSVHM